MLWCAAVSRVLSGRLSLAPKPHLTVPWHAAEVAATFLVFLIFSTIAAEAARYIGHVEPDTKLADLTVSQLATMQLIDSIAKILFLCVTIGILVVHCRATPRNLGVSWSLIPRDIFMGMVAFFFIVPAALSVKVLLSQWLDFGSHPIEELLSDPDNGRLLAIAMFVAVIVAPIAEEFFFRLLLQGWFENLVESGRAKSRHAGEADQDDRQQLSDESPQEDGVENGPSYELFWRSLPVLGSSLLFAVVHQGYDRIPLFVLALGLGYLFQYTGRLLPCILVHFMLNASSLAIVFLVS